MLVPYAVRDLVDHQSLAGTYTVYGIRYAGVGNQVHTTMVLNPRTGESTEADAKRQVAELLAGRGIRGEIVTCTVTLTPWS